MKNISRLSFLSLVSFIVLLAACNPKYEITNPYENVDWETHQQYKANLHTHTTRSDGNHSPHDIVDKYHELGYTILAITDHNEVTYPWEGFSNLNYSRSAYGKLKSGKIDSSAINYENRNPKKLEMYAIQANEVSAPHHMGSFFNNYNSPSKGEKPTIEAIDKLHGLCLLHHPGRYTSKAPEKYSVGWYVDIFTNYHNVTGMEVYNQGDRYKNDRKLWDNILQETMPSRPVWGYSNDDYHRGIGLGRNWNTFILPELSEEAIRQGMLEGRFFHTYATEGHRGPKVPQIKAIRVDNKKGMIEIQVNGQDSIHWISGGDVVGKGKTIKLSEIPELSKYLRAEIYGKKSVTGTQPFGING